MSDRDALVSGTNRQYSTYSSDALNNNAASLASEARTDNLTKMLSRPASARAAARWFVQTELLQQFQLIVDMDQEDRAIQKADNLEGQPATRRQVAFKTKRGKTKVFASN